jgi:hypothetical protein
VWGVCFQASARPISKNFVIDSANFGVVVLHGKHVVGLFVADGLGNGSVGAHRVDGDDHALEQQRVEQHRNGRQFVGLLGAGLLSQRQPRPHRKGADQMQGLLAGRLAAPARLAVNGHDTVRRQAGQHTAHPAAETVLDGPSVQQAKQAAQGVVRGNAAFQLQEAAQPIDALVTAGLDADELIDASEHRTGGHHQHLHQIVFSAPRHPRVGILRKGLRERQRLNRNVLISRLHELPQKDRKLHKSRGCESPPLRADEYLEVVTPRAFAF